MMHKAWSSIGEVPYCIARSSVKFQGRTALKVIQFDPDWAFPDCNLSLNSPMGTKRCTKLEVASKRCPIVLQGHPSNFTVTRAEKLTIWIQFEITRPVAAIKSLRFALLFIDICIHISWWYILVLTLSMRCHRWTVGQNHHIRVGCNLQLTVLQWLVLWTHQEWDIITYPAIHSVALIKI